MIFRFGRSAAGWYWKKVFQRQLSIYERWVGFYLPGHHKNDWYSKDVLVILPISLKNSPLLSNSPNLQYSSPISKDLLLSQKATSRASLNYYELFLSIFQSARLNYLSALNFAHNSSVILYFIHAFLKNFVDGFSNRLKIIFCSGACLRQKGVSCYDG